MKKRLDPAIVFGVIGVLVTGLILFTILGGKAGGDRLVVVDHVFTLGPGQTEEHMFVVYGNAHSWLEVTVEPSAGQGVDVRLVAGEDLKKGGWGPNAGYTRYPAFSADAVQTARTFKGEVPGDPYTLLLHNPSLKTSAVFKIIVVRDYGWEPKP